MIGNLVINSYYCKRLLTDEDEHVVSSIFYLVGIIHFLELIHIICFPHSVDTVNFNSMRK